MYRGNKFYSVHINSNPHHKSLLEQWCTVKEEIPTAISYADALYTGIGASASGSDKTIQCPSNTSGSLPVPQSSVSAQIYDLRAVPTRPLSPVASRTRSKLSKELWNEFKPIPTLYTRESKNQLHLLPSRPVMLLIIIHVWYLNFQLISQVSPRLGVMIWR